MIPCYFWDIDTQFIRLRTAFQQQKSDCLGMCVCICVCMCVYVCVVRVVCSPLRLNSAQLTHLFPQVCV